MTYPLKDKAVTGLNEFDRNCKATPKQGSHDGTNKPSDLVGHVVKGPMAE